ncbi:hypothetical protein [Pseudomonas indica]|uniref:hypothetical protein n=1 Tax=Pseudomonas indica TaxID=137658 RepID=UPI00146CFCED
MPSESPLLLQPVISLGNYCVLKITTANKTMTGSAKLLKQTTGNLLQLNLACSISSPYKITKIPLAYQINAQNCATPDLSGTVLPLCPIPNSALQNAPPFKSVIYSRLKSASNCPSDRMHPIELTITRELHRNRETCGSYSAHTAQQQAAVFGKFVGGVSCSSGNCDVMETREHGLTGQAGVEFGES